MKTLAKDKGVPGYISYEPLWNLMEKKERTGYWLTKKGINNATVDRLRKNLPITTETILYLCYLLNCQPKNILKYVADDLEE